MHKPEVEKRRRVGAGQVISYQVSGMRDARAVPTAWIWGIKKPVWVDGFRGKRPTLKGQRSLDRLEAHCRRCRE